MPKYKVIVDGQTLTVEASDEVELKMFIKERIHIHIIEIDGEKVDWEIRKLTNKKSLN